jgi:hypothetical protein
MSLARESNVTSVICKKQQKDSDKWQNFIGIKDSPFAERRFRMKISLPFSVLFFYHKAFCGEIFKFMFSKNCRL